MFRRRCAANIGSIDPWSERRRLAHLARRFGASIVIRLDALLPNAA